MEFRIRHASPVLLWVFEPSVKHIHSWAVERMNEFVEESVENR